MSGLAAAGWWSVWGRATCEGEFSPAVDEPRLASRLSVYQFDDCRVEGPPGFVRVLAEQRHDRTAPFGARSDAVVRYVSDSAENDAMRKRGGALGALRS